MRVHKYLPAVIFALLMALQPARSQDSDIIWMKGAHSQGVRGLAVSNDGKLCATASGDSTVKLWDISSGDLLKTMRGSHEATCVAIAGDRSFIASGGADGAVGIWDLSSGNRVDVWNAHTGGVLGVAITGNDRHIISGGEDGMLSIRHRATGTTLNTFAAYNGRARRVVFSDRGEMAALSGDSDTLMIWGFGPVAPYSRSIHAGIIRALALSPDGELAATAGADDSVKIWSTTTGQLLRAIKMNRSELKGLAFSPGGDTLASIVSYILTRHGFAEIELRSVADGSLIDSMSLRTDHNGTIELLAFLPEGKEILIGGWLIPYYGGMPNLDEYPVLRRYDLSSRTAHDAIGLKGPIAPIVFGSDGASVAAAGLYNTLRRWNLSGDLTDSRVFPEPVAKIGLASDGDHAVVMTASDEETGRDEVRIYDLTVHDSGRVVASWSVPLWYIARGGMYIAKAVGFDPLTLYTSDGNSIGAFGPATGNLAGDFSRDGEYFVWANADRYIRIVNAAQRRIIDSLDAGAPASAIASSWDNSQVASGFDDGTIKVWGVPGHELRATLTGHKGPVNALSFSPNGRFIVSAGADSTVRIWKIASQQSIHIYDEYRAPQISVAIAPDAKQIASGTADGTIILWHTRGEMASVREELTSRPEATLHPLVVNSSATATIEFSLMRSGKVELAVYSLSGEKVATLVDAVMETGAHHVSHDLSRLPSGVYICRLRINDAGVSAKFIVVR